MSSSGAYVRISGVQLVETSHPHAYSNRLMINGSSGNELVEYKKMEGKVKDLHGG